MTDIKNSTFCNGLSIHNYLIFDVDIYNKKTGEAKEGWEICKDFINYLKSLETFECWNNKTKKYNRKFIFQPDENYKLPEEFNDYIEIIKKAVVWSLPNNNLVYENNGCIPKKFPV